MTLLGKPVPALDHIPNPWGAPPGVEVDFDHFHQWPDKSKAWWTNRPVCKMKGAVVHTMAASVEAKVDSSMRHGNSSKNATKPHYNVGRRHPTRGKWKGPVKCVPSDRRAIANSTGSGVEYQYGCPDASFWLLAIETADAGSKKAINGDYGDFIEDPEAVDHDEIVARILAYESMVWGFRLRVPPQFYTDGVYTHTEPWPYPYLTTKPGKTCPTKTKKDRVLRGDIIPRAIEIRNHWEGVTPPAPTPGDEDMKRSWPNRIDSRTDDFHGALSAGEVRSVRIAGYSVGMAADALAAVVNVTVVPKNKTNSGFLAVWPAGEFEKQAAIGHTQSVHWNQGDNEGNSMTVPLDGKGNLLIRATDACNFVIDIPGLWF